MSDWLADAACRGRPTDWWFPIRGDHFAARVAIVVCKSCPVRAECLAAALVEEAVVDGPRSGIRGGVTAEARSRLAGHVAPVLSVEVVEQVRPAWTGRQAWPRLVHATPL